MKEHKKLAKAGKKPASLDGIVSDGRQLGLPTNRSYRPGQQIDAPALGGAGRRGDGFHALRQSLHSLGQSPETAEAEALLDEPIILDDDKKSDKKGKKKHYFGNKPSRLRKFAKRAALVLTVILLAIAGLVGYKFYHTQKEVFSGGGHAPAVCDGDVQLDELKKEGDGRVNILLLGIGSEGLLTDSIMIASLDPATDKIDLLSIPRDLWVNIAGHGQEKINAAYEFGQQDSSSKSRFAKNQGGVALLDKTLENVVGVTIHYHAVFNFVAFKQIVNALGGVTVNVPENLYDPTIAWENSYNPVIATKGIQKFDGQKALLYAKSREYSSDFLRSERQRLLLVAIKDKALSVGTFSNPVKIIQLLNSLGKNVYSDFDTQSIKCLYKQVSQVQSNNIKSLDLVTPPNNLVATGNMNGKSIVQPKLGLFDYTDIRTYVRSAFRDGFLAKENAKVAVYNATNVAGAATREAAVLKSYGYNLATIGDAKATNPQTTVLVDLSNGVNKYTRHYLELRFGVTVRDSVPGDSGLTPPPGTAFVIILGKDVTTNST